MQNNKKIMGTLFIAITLIITLICSVSIFAYNDKVTGEIKTTTSAITKDTEVDVITEITGMTDASTVVPSDVILILDTSGSMDGVKINNLKKAAIDFSQNIDLTYHRLGLVTFSSSPIEYNFISDDSERGVIEGALNNIVASGGTYIGSAINSAIKMMDGKRSGAKPMMVIMTDGQAQDEIEELAAAERAKKAGIIFYTIALVNDENNISSVEQRYLGNMQQMATTGTHHYFIGADRLREIYNIISYKIGLSTAYDVQISEELSPQFSLVADSEKTGIPNPSVSGKKLTWKLLELGDERLSLPFKVKVNDSVANGTYPLFSSGKVTYKDYDGNLYSFDLPGTSICVSNKYEVLKKETVSDGTINGEYTPKSIEEGKSGTLKATVSGCKSAKSLEMYIGNTKLNLLYISNKEVRAGIPKTLTAGNYDVTIIKDGEALAFQDKFEVIKESVPGPEFGAMTPVTYKAGPAMSIIQEAKNLNYGSDFKILYGDKPATFMAKTATKFVFKIPEKVPVGDYYITVISNGRRYTMKDRLKIVNEIIEPADYKEIVPNTVEEGKAGVSIKINGSKIPTGKSDLKVTIGGVSTSILANRSDVIAVKYPGGLPVGKYLVEITNGGETVVKDEWFEVTEKLIPSPEYTAISPSIVYEDCGKTSIKITGANILTSQSDLSVKVGGVDTTILANRSDVIAVSYPGGLPVGKYPVEITNGGETVVKDEWFEVEEKPVPSVEYTAITPNNIKETDLKTSFKITGIAIPTGQSDLSVKIGGIDTTIMSNTSSAIAVSYPGGLSAGLYPIEITNGGETVIKEDWVTIEEVIPEETTFDSLAPDNGKKGRKVSVKIYGTKIPVSSKDLIVNVGGEKATIMANSRSDYMAVSIPGTLDVGTYDVNIHINGKDYTIENGFSVN